MARVWANCTGWPARTRHAHILCQFDSLYLIRSFERYQTSVIVVTAATKTTKWVQCGQRYVFLIYCFANLPYYENCVVTSKSVPEGVVVPGGLLPSSQYVTFKVWLSICSVGNLSCWHTMFRNDLIELQLSTFRANDTQYNVRFDIWDKVLARQY